MGTLNSAVIIGRLGRDPELKYTPTNVAVLNMSIATSERGKDKQERTEWHRVTVWGDTAEACSKYLRKGSECCVQGRLQTRTWDDKDGAKRSSTEIVAERVVFIGGATKGDSAAPGAHDATPSDDMSGDVPF